jgi:hypothetical protein
MVSVPSNVLRVIAGHEKVVEGPSECEIIRWRVDN